MLIVIWYLLILLKNAEKWHVPLISPINNTDILIGLKINIIVLANCGYFFMLYCHVYSNGFI